MIAEKEACHFVVAGVDPVETQEVWEKDQITIAALLERLVICKHIVQCL